MFLLRTKGDSMSKPGEPTCSECGVISCRRRDNDFPDFCLTKTTDPEQVQSVVDHLAGDNLEARMARAASEIEGLYFGNATRLEEVVLFAKRIGARRIGVATCSGLIEEARIVSRVLRAKGLEPHTIVCKVGSRDKTEIGISEETKIQIGSFEAMCNPILQAKLLNAQKTELNVIVGLCVGHDSLFIRYSDPLCQQ
jgi:uncharacterized metal-binding protein